MIITLFAITIWLSICMLGLSKRVSKLEREIPADIERARHEGWLDGVLYQAELEKRRHPRDPKTKQFVSRT